MKVVDEKNNHIGKVVDFTMSLLNFSVQQIIIKRPFFKSLNNPELTVHRSQITKIDDEKITIHSETEEKIISNTEKSDNFVPNYTNPFRN